jgi:hypothetical protein
VHHQERGARRAGWDRGVEDEVGYSDGGRHRVTITPETAKMSDVRIQISDFRFQMVLSEF